jgi:glycosyltransferase involved in cell wall biosynthesis
LDAPVVLSLGRLHRIKRLDLLADAFLKVRQRLPSAHLVIAGPDEHGLQPQLAAQLASARGFVHWTGHVDHATKPVLLETATVLVQCSDSESFGMSIAEALGAGTPVVVTRTCPWEHIERWHCGFWVEQNADAIASALARLLTNPELAAEQGSAGRRFVEEQLGPARIAEAWRAAYHAATRSDPAAA